MSAILPFLAWGSALAVSIAPSPLTRGATAGGSVGNATATPTGAQGPFTYAWTVIEPDPQYPLTIGNPNAATASFTFEAPGTRETARAKVRCTVTAGGQQASAELTVIFTNNDPTGWGGFPGAGGPGQDVD